MGVDTFAILVSFAAAIVLVAVIGRVLKLLLKIALVCAVAWLLYAKVWPQMKKATEEARRLTPVSHTR